MYGWSLWKCAQSLLCLSLPVVQGYSDFCFERHQSHATTATPVIFLILRMTSIYILYAEIRCIPFHSYLLLVCCLLINSCHSAHREGKYNPVVALHQFRFTKCDKSLWWCLSSRLLAVCFSIKTQSCCFSAAIISLRVSDHSRLLCFLLF